MNTSPAAARLPKRFASLLARFALVLAALCGVAELLAGPAYRLGLVSLGAALGTMRWAATAALATAAIALVATIQAARAGERPALTWAIAALVLALAVATPPLWLYMQVQRLPRIHDISTDTANPPKFVAVLPLRLGARNPVDYAPATALQQKSGYPDIAPLTLSVPPAEAFARAERAANALGWTIVATAAVEGRLEATDTTPLFGFKDDIVVRVTPATDGGSIVDVRSLSRVGGSDFGTNAKRVRAFLRRME
jgi:uncharacterized protein (DUF1499 family)